MSDLPSGESKTNQRRPLAQPPSESTRGPHVERAQQTAAGRRKTADGRRVDGRAQHKTTVAEAAPPSAKSVSLPKQISVNGAQCHSPQNMKVSEIEEVNNGNAGERTRNCRRFPKGAPAAVSATAQLPSGVTGRSSETRAGSHGIHTIPAKASWTAVSPKADPIYAEFKETRRRQRMQQSK